MTRQYELIIFDWDGTLMDSAAKIVSCMQKAAQRCGVTVPTAAAVSHIIGISLKPAIKQLFNTDDDELAERLTLAYKEVYLGADTTPCPLFDGVEAMLSDLTTAGYKLAVATGKARRGLNRAWEQTGTGHFFTTSRCADEADSKPSPDMLLQLLAEQGLSAGQALMIGDTTYDMQMAQAIGMDRVGVSYGVHAAVNLAKHHPKAIVHSIDELHRLIMAES
ncbi:HAD family hydrolase [Alteromonas lipolytica]|uniref:HAD family hydrolase n=1 Tax=Alteromonas lipolytica TaxID=1856405 RepID=A0A1E8FK41_9ALTE|nr:HAD-IA family hydrolase [Alteromonas lipolytica]OFI35803.1 HAD family hydrolase [Alteromonas lipolytica]GGF80960.1 haloacid dehalogenase [Alteromonas lipolytica]